MRKGFLTAVLIFLMQAFSATAEDIDLAYREALLKELNNRKLANLVVTALAQAHSGKPQGDFWVAYSQLEASQWPLYEEQAKHYKLTPGSFFLSLKAQGSILFAKVSPDKFIEVLTQATADYASELEAIKAPETQQKFWSYVVAQEKAQVKAFQYASKQDYVAAASALLGFMESNTGPLLDFNR